MICHPALQPGTEMVDPLKVKLSFPGARVAGIRLPAKPELAACMGRPYGADYKIIYRPLSFARGQKGNTNTPPALASLPAA